MQSSKTPLSPPAPSAPPAAVMSRRAPSTLSARRRIGTRARVAIASGAAICLLILGVVVALSRAPANAPAGSRSVPSSWQTYRDPAGLFSLRLPPGWTAQVTAGTASIANGGGSATEKTELVVFSDPAGGPTATRVSIFAEPIRTDFERQWYCRGRAQQQSTFHNLPAEHYGSTWIFSTAGAHFQVMYAVPSPAEAVGSPPASPAAKATPTAKAASAGDRATAELILGSFQAANASPLAC